MFLKRVLTAIVLLPVLIGAIIYGEKTGAAVVIALAAAVGVFEYLRLTSPGLTKAEEVAISLWGGVIVLSFLAKSPLVPGAALALGVQAYAIWDAYRAAPDRATLGRIGHVAAGLALCAFFPGFGVSVSGHGYKHLLFIMFLVMSGDTGAYVTGSLVGRHKLAPRISPKKTIEGSVGGLILTALVAYFVNEWFRLGFEGATAIAVAAAVNVVAQIGDLVESHLKRAAGVKDSGTIFPGHGGMLDRIDAFIPTLPLYAAILALVGV